MCRKIQTHWKAIPGILLAAILLLPAAVTVRASETGEITFRGDPVEEVVLSLEDDVLQFGGFPEEASENSILRSASAQEQQ